MASRFMWVLFITTLLCMSSFSECRKTTITSKRTHKGLLKQRTRKAHRHNTLHIKYSGCETHNTNNPLLNSRLPSGPSPGVGNSVPTNSISNRLSLGKKMVDHHRTDSLISSRLPSGPSPGVGNSVPTDSISNRLSLGKKMVNHHKADSLINSRLPSGPSPGVGNSVPTASISNRLSLGKKRVGYHETGSLISSRMPSGPSPGTGHSHSPAPITDTITNRLSIARLRGNKIPHGSISHHHAV